MTRAPSEPGSESVNEDSLFLAALNTGHRLESGNSHKKKHHALTTQPTSRLLPAVLKASPRLGLTFHVTWMMWRIEPPASLCPEGTHGPVSHGSEGLFLNTDVQGAVSVPETSRGRF